MVYDVFISASKEDKATADAACAFLEREGLRCWIAPRDIPPGKGFGEGIISGINQSRMMVLIFSSHANGSHHVQREVERAVHRGIPIIPFRIENVPPERGLEYFLSLPNWLDAFDPPLEQHLRRLDHATRQLLQNLADDVAIQFAPKNTAPMASAANPPAAVPLMRRIVSDWRIAGGVLAVVVLAGAISFWLVRSSSAPIGVPPSNVQSASAEIVLNFNTVDTTAAPGYMVAAAPYLHEAPIAISVNVPDPAESRIVFVNNLGLYEGHGVEPTKSQNFLTQTNTGNVPASFTLTFAKPIARISFLVPRVYAATESGITFPAWRAVALSASGEELSSKSQGLVRRFATVPAETVELSAPAFEGIAAVKFTSDPRLNGRPFAAFSAILIEELRLTPRQE